jgi:hypothetical protein
MSIAAAAAGLRGAGLLAVGRAEGLLLIAACRDRPWVGFWALPLTVVIVAGFRLLVWVPAGNPGAAGVPLLRDMMAFTVGWLAFAVLTHRLILALSRGPRWPGFITAWNWSNLIANLLIVAGLLPGLFGAPAAVDQAAQLIMAGWALWLEWFVTRVTLGVTPLTAVLFVLLDQAIELLLAVVGSAPGTGG